MAVRSGNDIIFVGGNGKPLKKPGGVEDVAKKLGHAAVQRTSATSLSVGWLDAFVAPGSEHPLLSAMHADMARRWDEDDGARDPAV